MGTKGVLVLLVVAAAAAVFLLLGGLDLLGGGTAGGGRGGAPDAGDPLGAEGGRDGAPGTAGGAAARHGPVLFGRARAERAGVGALVGRVKEFESGEPLPEATVVLAGEGYGGETTAVQLRTDAEGAFRFESVAAGDAYVLQVTDTRERRRALPAVTVDAGAETDLGVLWLGQAAALEGVVVDAAGRPVAAADVQVHAGSGSMLDLLQNLTKLLEVLDQDAEPLARTASARDGRFTVADLAPGPYTLVVRARGHQVATQNVVMTSGGAAGGAVTVHVVPAEAVAGIVVDERDRPVAGARVACLDKNEMTSVFYGRQFSVTGPDGRFRIDTPPTQGAFAVIVAAAGYPALFTEAEAGAGELRLVLVDGTEVLVRVLQTLDERPVEGAHLTAMFSRDLATGENRNSFATGTTDERGEAVFLARPGKLQMLMLDHPEHGSCSFNPMLAMMGQAGILAGPSDTSVGEGRTTFVFRLDAGVTVRGTVTDEDGRPVAGARVRTMGALGLGSSGTCDDEGRYELRHQSLPVALVMASAPGYVQSADPTAMAAAAQALPDAAGVVTRDLQLQRAASVSGRVVDEAGHPLPGVQVKVGGGRGAAMLRAMLGGARESITNARGRYVLDGVAPGEGVHVMGHTRARLDSKTADFAVGGGAVQAPDLVMPPGAHVTVRVEEPDGRAAGGARVEVSVAASETVLWDPLMGWSGFADRVTPASGRTELEDVPDGRLTVTATKAGFAPGRSVLQLERARQAEAEVVVRLGIALRVAGRVLGADGAPLEGAMVQTVPSEDAPDATPTPFVPSLSVTTDAQGRFELAGLAAGAVTLRVTAQGYRAAQPPVQAGDEALEVRLAPSDPGAAKRLEEVQQELMRLSQAMGQAKDEAERKALGARLVQLIQEQRRLEEEQGGAPAPDGGR